MNSERSFLEKFVEETLPPACRDWPESALEEMIGISFLKRSLQSVCASVCVCVCVWATTFVRAATVEEIREAVNQAKPYSLKEEKELKARLLGVTVNSILKASIVLHGSVDKKELSKEKCRKLLQSVEPYIYGGTPFYQSIEKAIELLQASSF